MVSEAVASKDRTNFDALFVEAKSGGTDALGELLESYRGYLRVLAGAQLSRKLAQRTSPSDIVQETMLAAHRDFQEFRGECPGQFTAWLRTILARNLFRAIERHLKTGKRDARREVSIQAIKSSLNASSCALANLLVAPTATASSIVSQDEQLVRMYELLSLLPDDYRTVITLRNLNSMRFEAIAEQMGRSTTAVRLLWLRAIRRMRSMVERDGRE